MCGILIDSFGWESAFYVIGSITCVWFVFWWFLVFDTPGILIFSLKIESFKTRHIPGTRYISTLVQKRNNLKKYIFNLFVFRITSTNSQTRIRLHQK